MSNHIISSSCGLNLQFQDEATYQRFKEDEKCLYKRYYEEIREKHGVWATNQGKFVASADDLNKWDSKFMERLI